MSMKPFNEKYADSFGLQRVDSLSFSGSKSPRINGKLVLRQNPFSLISERGRYGTFGIKSPQGAFSQKSTTSFMTSRYVTANGHTKLNSGLRTDAIFAAYSNLNSKVANVADIIRTRRETMNMVSNRVAMLVKTARDLRHGRISEAGKRLGAELHPNPKSRRGQPVGARWLEYSYGWSPLIDDLYKILDKGFGPIILHASSTKRSTLSESYIDSFGKVNTYDGKAVMRVGVVSERRCKVRLWAQVPNSRLSGISNWGLDNPVALAWEALPYSFVVDWFLPVGSYLEMACNLTGNISVSSACVSESIETTASGTYDSYIDYKGYQIFNPSSPFLYHYRAKNRSNNVPSLPLPRFKSPFSGWKRTLNQLGLLNVELNKKISR